MSAHTRHRKVFVPSDGSHVEVVVTIHNIDPTPADLIVSSIVRAAEHAIEDYREAINDRAVEEAKNVAARVAALRKQNDPDDKVVSHGSAELHELRAEQTEPAKPAKPGKEKLKVLKSEAAQ